MSNIKIKVEIKDIIYRNIETGYTVASVNLIEHPNTIMVPTAVPTASGYFWAIHKKDEFELEGQWEDTGKYGFQFKAETVNLIYPETSKGIADFLEETIKGVGVGQKTIKAIVDKFKEDSLDVIKNNKHELLTIKGITIEKAEAMQKLILQHKDFEKATVALAPLGLSMTLISKAYNMYGYNIVQIVKDNPYQLCNILEVSFKDADTIASKMGIKANDIRRIQQGLIGLIDYNLRNKGNLFIYKDVIIKELREFLVKNTAFSEEIIITELDLEEILKKLAILNKVKIEKDEDNRECVYVKFYLDMENGIVEMLVNMLNNSYKIFGERDKIDELILGNELETGFKLAKEQKEAIYNGLTKKISILTGGPGTGKTATVNQIIKCIKKIDPLASIELTASTGKAAKRMTELTCMEAKTIHRLIGLGKENEEVRELKSIESDFLIIDEASMVDAYLFYSLLTTVSYNTKVIIVGDFEQLPSVGPGLVLRDLIESKVVPTTILTEIFRQAQDSQIVMNAHTIIKGSKALSLDNSKEDFYFIEEDKVNRIRNKILKSIDRLLATGFTLDDIQVLSVLNNGDLGVLELNRIIQERYNPYAIDKVEIEISKTRILRENDRVMQTENNYEFDVFNGETGKIISINLVKGELVVAVDFGDKEVEYGADTISQLILAYAITVHKSQGSEFPVVIMPLHKSLSCMLNRNIIYTGLTRAKERVICIGDREELNNGIDRVHNTIRNSQIKAKLRKRLP